MKAIKYLAIGSLIIAGGVTVAMTNETVNAGVTNTYEEVKGRFFKRGENKEPGGIVKNGIPYPSETYLETLSDDQALAITTQIDLLNATYDWANLTDEEFELAIEDAKTQLTALYEELGLEAPSFGKYLENRNERRFERLAERIATVKESGLPYPSDERAANLTDEQLTAITQKIDELNATYDWANMTDEEIEAAFEVVKSEMSVLRDELGIERPERSFEEGFRRGASRGYREGFKDGFKRGRNHSTEDVEEVEETNTEDSTGL